MTGHTPSGPPADHEPTPTQTGATKPDAASPDAANLDAANLDASGSPPADTNIELDRQLAASGHRLLEVLQSSIDVDAGLAAIRATHRAASEPPATRRPGDRQASGPAEPDASGEVGAVCLLLADYLTGLAPAGDHRTGVPPGLGGSVLPLGGSVLALGAVHRLLEELRSGLLYRTLDRHAADRLLRLIEHNAAEAGQLLREERRRAGRRLRPEVEGWMQTTAAIRDGMAGLRPRILRLYDDAGQATTQPAPRLPV